MTVTQEQIKNISKLSKIRLKDEEKTTADLNSILGYVEQLNQVDTTWVIWTVNVLNTYARLREDIINSEKNPDLFKNTKQKIVANQISIDKIMN